MPPEEQKSEETQEPIPEPEAPVEETLSPDPVEPAKETPEAHQPEPTQTLETPPAENTAGGEELAAPIPPTETKPEETVPVPQPPVPEPERESRREERQEDRRRRNFPSVRELVVKAREVIQSKKRKKLDKLMTLFNTKPQIKNDDVEKLLHVSDATATRYLSELEKQGRVVQVGKEGRGVWYARKS